MVDRTDIIKETELANRIGKNVDATNRLRTMLHFHARSQQNTAGHTENAITHQELVPGGRRDTVLHPHSQALWKVQMHSANGLPNDRGRQN